MDTILKDLYDVMPTQTFYHYTSIDGLQGIVDSRSIWATEIRYLRKGTSDYCYELVEVPKALLKKAATGRFKMMSARRLSDIRKHENFDAHIWLRINDLDSVNMISSPPNRSFSAMSDRLLAIWYRDRPM